MRFNNDNLINIDLEWFAVDSKGHIGQFTTGGCGFVPESVISSVNNNELLIDYILSLNYLSHNTIIVDENLSAFDNEKLKEKYLRSFIQVSSKGLFCFDVTDLNPGLNKSYKLIAIPEKPINILEINDDIKKVLKLTEYKNEFNRNKLIKINDIL